MLAPQLPLTVPAPLAVGAPGAGYPWTWGIYRWLPGQEAGMERFADPDLAARDLAGFLRALQLVETADGPRGRARGSGRGAPLTGRDQDTRQAIAELRGEIDVSAVTAAWQESLAARPHDGALRWIHGDLMPSNLLVSDGRLSAVIDFSCLGVGDPACDLVPAWNLFSARSRHIFRAELDVDADAWARGRGWALSLALIALPYYLTTNPGIVAVSRRAIDAVLNYR